MLRVVNVIPQNQSGDITNDSEATVAVDPIDPRRIAVSTTTSPAIADGGGTLRGQVYVSANAGQSWQPSPIIPTAGVRDITLDFAGLVGAGGTSSGGTRSSPRTSTATRPTRSSW